jgi:creatinine amidohydrolase
VLTASVAAVSTASSRRRQAHVCLVNNHLEPAHDAASAPSSKGARKASVACPLTRKWARTLSAEFKSGACHAGQYETSIMMAAAPEMVDESMRSVLQPVPISLSEKLAAGVTTFAAMGMELAYAGNPAGATVEEGEQQIGKLADMVVGEIREALGLPT